MRRRSHSTSNAIWKYILFVCVVFAVLYRTYIGVRTHSIRIDYNGLPNVVSSADSGTDDFTEEDTLLRDIPNITTQQWQTYDFLIVLGIPSIDIDARQRRRYLQRSTCWRFPGVATRANNFTGAMLVLYVLARHPSHNFTYSAGLEAEAEQWHDVIALPMNDGRPSTSKKVGGDGKWGLEAEIGLSRKTFFWFELALRLFPTATYFAKGDDDTFLRVPQYLADLRTLPRKGLYWGPVGYYSVGSARAKLSFRFIVGFCMTLARDVVWKFVSYRPLQRLARLPYTSQRLLEYQALNMNSEDIMVGRVLYEVRYSNLYIVTEGVCRFHDIHKGEKLSNVKPISVAVHHVLEGDYAQLMERFGDDIAPIAQRFARVRERYLTFPCKQWLHERLIYYSRLVA